MMGLEPVKLTKGRASPSSSFGAPSHPLQMHGAEQGTVSHCTARCPFICSPASCLMYPSLDPKCLCYLPAGDWGCPGKSFWSRALRTGLCHSPSGLSSRASTAFLVTHRPTGDLDRRSGITCLATAGQTDRGMFLSPGLQGLKTRLGSVPGAALRATVS